MSNHIEQYTTLGITGATKAAVIAALIGGLISWQWMNDMKPKQKLLALISGCAMAYYICEPISDIFADGKFIGVIGLLTGLFGMSVCSLIFKLIQSITVSDVLGIFERVANRIIDGIMSKFPAGKNKEGDL